MTKRKIEYQIGDWVEVAATVKFSVSHDNRRKPVRSPQREPFTAQIVGAARKQIGIYHFASYSAFDQDGGDNTAYLECKGTVLVWLVRRGMTNRQIEVLPDDLTHGIHNVKQCLPWRWTNPTPWSDEDRKRLSNVMKNLAVRDPQTGKFTKETKE